MWSWVHDQKRCKKNARVVVRALDWEVWAGMARCPNVGKFADEIIAIAPHIKRKLEAENPSMKGRVTLIRPGVDLKKFTLKKSFCRYKVIMPVNDIDWWMKGTLDGLKVFKMLTEIDPRPWELQVKGIWTKGEPDRAVIHHYVETAGLKDRVKFVDEHVPDYNAYLEQFDYCIKPSYKDAFSYVVAECAAKGIKPILNHWIGAEEIWPKEWLYTSHKQAVKKFFEPSEPIEYRKYVEDNYPIEKMFKEYDELCGT